MHFSGFHFVYEFAEMLKNVVGLFIFSNIMAVVCIFVRLCIRQRCLDVHVCLYIY